MPYYYKDKYLKEKEKMAKKKLGLVLGAGAARGLAHIGVIKVLEKNNIKPDYIMGSSMGALIGAYYALHGSIEGIEEKVNISKRDLFALVDIRKPKKSLIKGRKIKRFLKSRFKNKTFEDLKIPLGVITTDLVAGEEFLITEGKLLDALMASITVPVILPPVKYNGKWLVDGDVSHCNSVEIIRKSVDKVIYVDVMTEERKKIKKLDIIRTLVYSYDVKRQQIFSRIKKRKDTVIIKPNVDWGFNFFKFHEYEKFISEGEKAARRKIREIKELIGK